MIRRWLVLLLAALLASCVRRAASSAGAVLVPHPTATGFLAVDPSANASMFFAYYEALSPTTSETPLILWLQGGPGCASNFGNFYELGPFLVNDSLALKANPGAWNRKNSVLFIDQPIGTGFSRAGSRDIPRDELTVASDLYMALQAFFHRHVHLQTRPFFITGESYGGKYVPAIGHFIIQAERASKGQQLSSLRAFPHRARLLGPPAFKLAGLAIGNGFTDPVPQTLQMADTAFFMGLIDSQQRAIALAQQLEVVQLVHAGEFEKAHKGRTALLNFISRASGAGTLLDQRRVYDYDHNDNVGRYLNQPEVKQALGVDLDQTFVSCSDVVGQALGPDMMQSAAVLIPDILDHKPMLLYAGQFDAQDGVATQEAWLATLPWAGQSEWRHTPRRLWSPKLPAGSSEAELQSELCDVRQSTSATSGDAVAGYWKHLGPLTQVVLRNAGHMVPHDVPLQAQAMLERWIDDVLQEQLQLHTEGLAHNLGTQEQTL